MPDEVYRNYLLHRLQSNSVARDNGCLEYGGGELKHKYGLVSVTIDGVRKNVPASRAMWMATHGEWDLPTSINVCHTCDNPPCINIEHLFKGTSTDNRQDMLAKGRGAKKYRPHTRQRDVSDEVVESIRNATGKYYAIAFDNGVSVGYVSKIKTGRLKKVIKPSAQ